MNEQSSFIREGVTPLTGLIIGAASGAIQFLILSKFTRAVTGGTLSVKSALFGVLQFFLPLIVLLGCALLFPKGLMWSGIGMAATLIACALVSFILRLKSAK